MRFALTYIILSLFWVLWSGKFDAFHLSLGLLSVWIVSKWSSDLFIGEKHKPFFQWVVELIRFERYTLYLVKEIFKANLHVMKVALSPNVEAALNPQMVEFKTTLQTDIAKFVLAQSITLTPGTVTARIDQDSFIIHALTDETASGIPGEMQQKIQHVFENGGGHA